MLTGSNRDIPSIHTTPDERLIFTCMYMKNRLEHLVNRYKNKFVSHWLILTMDITIVVFSFFWATYIRFNFELEYPDPGLYKYHLALVMGVNLLAFLFWQTHRGIIRHSSLEESRNVLYACLTAFFLLLAIGYFRKANWGTYLHVPASILLINFFISVFALLGSRMLIKYLYRRLTSSYKNEQKVIIYGAGTLGRATKKALGHDQIKRYHILFFVDDDSGKTGKTLEGIRIYNHQEALNVLKKDGTARKDIELIFAIHTNGSTIMASLTEEFLEMGLRLKVVPPIEKWLSNKLSSKQIANVRIEDLLERPSIRVNNGQVAEIIKDRCIMITGAAGSIGSEIVRQVLLLKPASVVLIDQAESALYDLESELLRMGDAHIGNTRFIIKVENITNRVEMKRIFEQYRPHLVFHAAAYKHVPLMEANPAKAIEVNVLGTRNLADLAVRYGVEKFVFISTDKAVNPTNVMGASKRLAEMYVQSRNSQATRFITTRFGNVLGSNGSVIPLFRKQIEAGGPVTVTHPDIIRYFMTIPEACQLVLEAGTMGKGGEIFVFDMGVPVRIADLAVKMIRLSGLEPHTGIPIVYSGLRPGEKLYEELLNNGESVLPTYHPKIMIAQVSPHDDDLVGQELEHLQTIYRESPALELVRFLKKMVPEYISNNSPYEKLDQTADSEVEIR